MNMKNNKSLFLKTIGIVGVAWLIVVLLLNSLHGIDTLGIVGLVSGLLSFILVCGMNVLPERCQVRNDASAFAIPFVISAGYLIVSVVFNTILVVVSCFVYMSFKWLATVAVIINVLSLAGFAVYSLFALAYLGNLQQKDSTMREKTATPANISSLLGTALAMTDDAKIKAALCKLKETVDYSTNTSSAASIQTEREFAHQVEEIQSAIQNGDDVEKLLNLIDQAAKIWRGRNASVK